MLEYNRATRAKKGEVAMVPRHKKFVLGIVLLSLSLLSARIHSIMSRDEARRKINLEYTLKKDGLMKLIDRFLEVQEYFKEQAVLLRKSVPSDLTINKNDAQKLIQILQDLRNKKKRIAQMPTFQSELTKEIFKMVYETSNTIQASGFPTRNQNEWKPIAANFIDEAVGIIKAFTPLQIQVVLPPSATPKQPTLPTFRRRFT